MRFSKHKVAYWLHKNISGHWCFVCWSSAD